MTSNDTAAIVSVRAFRVKPISHPPYQEIRISTNSEQALISMTGQTLAFFIPESQLRCNLANALIHRKYPTYTIPSGPIAILRPL